MKIYDLLQMRNFTRNKDLLANLFFHGEWTFTTRRVDGSIKQVERVHNIIPNEAINYLLNTAIHDASGAISAWYFAPFTTSYTPTADDTYAAPGYTEANSEISEANRQEWADSTAASQSITASTVATITAASNVSIYGAGLVGGGSAADTKADTAGGGIILSSAAGTQKDLETNETLDMSYTINGSSS